MPLTVPRSFRWSLALVLFVLACRPPRPQASWTPPPSSPAKATEASALGPGDVLEVRVFQEADLSGTFRVSPDGTIDYPLCGKVKLLQETQSQAASTLERCLKDGRFLQNPHVSVLIKEFNSKKIFVFGEVQKPGTFAFEDQMSIVQAITLAGGFTKTAAKNGTTVTRVIDGHETRLRVPVEDIAEGREKNFLLQPNDIVTVPESFF